MNNSTQERMRMWGNLYVSTTFTDVSLKLWLMSTRRRNKNTRNAKRFSMVDDYGDDDGRGRITLRHTHKLYNTVHACLYTLCSFISSVLSLYLYHNPHIVTPTRISRNRWEHLRLRRYTRERKLKECGRSNEEKGSTRRPSWQGRVREWNSVDARPLTVSNFSLADNLRQSFHQQECF